MGTTILLLFTSMPSIIYADDFSCCVLTDMIKKDQVCDLSNSKFTAKILFWQHYFAALFYGNGCLTMAVVPIPLAPTGNKCLWDFSVWLTAPGDSANILTKDIVVSMGDRRLHCIIYHVRQTTAFEWDAQNKMLSDKFWSWYGNVLVVWTNHSWLYGLEIHKKDLQDVLYSL